MELPNSPPKAEMQTMDETTVGNNDVTSTPRPSGLLHLSNELIIGILQHTFHQNLVNFALTCKLLYLLASEALVHHRALIGELSTLTNFNGPLKLATALLTMLDDPRRASYVRELFVLGWETRRSSIAPAGRKKELVRTAEAVRTGSAQLVENLLIDEGGPASVDAIMKGIAAGDEQCAIGILLTLLPNLTKLAIRFLWDQHSSPMLSLVLKRSLLSTPGQHNFGKLKSVMIQGNSYDGTFDVVRTCAQLPSLETLVAAECMIERYRDQYRWDSNVNYFALKWCKWAAGGTIYELLRSMKQLKRFEYEQRDHTDNNAGLFRPKPVDICGWLQNSVVDSLENLELVGLDDEWVDGHRGVGSLRSFYKLQAIDIDFTILFDAAGGCVSRDPLSLGKKLPISIRRVRLESAGCSEYIEAFLKLFLEEHETSPLPNLEKLYIAGIDKDFVEALEDADWISQLAALGIELSFLDQAPPS